jgi:UDPglucose--hexose-1-phosphate uridylyltransferase
MGASTRNEDGAELRRNMVSGKWTVVAPARASRPSDTGAPDAGAPGTCPFCPGNETLTPPELDAFRAAGSPANEPGWRVRVVPNKYPAFDCGHEVIVHAPDHEAELEDLDGGQVADVLAMYQRRIAAQYEAGARAVTIVHNRGARAGASLAHPHSQLLATPLLPPLLQDELDNFDRYRNRYGDCLICAELERARDEPSRLVIEGPVAVFAPLAPRFGYEIWLTPEAHQTDFREADTGAVAAAVRRSLAALAAAAAGAPLNFWLHTAPPDLHGPFHWHLEIAARLSQPAGFELGTDMSIVAIDPVEAAAALRRRLA